MKYIITLFIFSFPIFIKAQILSENTSINITKSWSQEPNGYTYPITIRIPEGDIPEGGFPVCILLHGNGGNGMGMANQFSNKLSCHALVAPSGYLNSWNITDEASEAPDVEMVNELIEEIQNFSNINPDKIRILGFSNGGALANRLFIENNNSGVDIITSVVSQFSEAQYRNGNFYSPSGATGGNDPYDGYDVITTPIQGRKYLNICNFNDGLIPYEGGMSVGVNFLHAQDAIFYAAQSQGYNGNQLGDEGTDIGNNIFEYSYLSDQVVHLKGDANHGINIHLEDYIINFFNNCSVISSTHQSIKNEIKIGPNPVLSTLQLIGDVEIGTPYKIMNTLGQNVQSGVINTNQNIDVSRLPNNIYFIQIGDKSVQFIKG